MGLILNQKTGLVSPQFHIKYDNNFDTVKELDMVEDWKIQAGFVAQRETRENESSNLEMNKTSSSTPSSNEKQTRDKSTCSKSKRVRFNMSKEPELKMNQVQSPDPDINEININKDVMPAVEAVNNGLRRSPRLNPEINKGKELIALQSNAI